MKDLTKSPKTLKELNKVIQSVYPNVNIAKSEGCFYIYSDDVKTSEEINLLYCTSIYVNSINQQSFQGWIDSVEQLFNSSND